MFVDFSKPTNLLFVVAALISFIASVKFIADALLDVRGATYAIVGLLVLLGLAFGYLCMRHPAAQGMMAVMAGFVVLSLMLTPGLGTPVGAGGLGVEGAKVLASGDGIPVFGVRLYLRYLSDFGAPALVILGMRYLNRKSRQ